MAALKCFGELGYANTSISRIAQEASISKGLIYHYFNSKEDLLKGIFQFLLERGDEIIGNWSSSDPKEQLKQTIDQSFGFIKSNKGLMRFMLSLAIQPEIAQNIQSFFEKEKKQRIALFANIFKELGYEDPEEEAYYAGAIMDGIALSYVSLDHNYPIDKMYQKIIKKYNL